MGIEKYELEIYQDEKGKKPFLEWISSIKDHVAVAKINARLLRLRLGNMSDFKSLGESLFELRIDTGPGYRLYFSHEDSKKLILLGGNKKTQNKDIIKARQYLNQYRN